MRLSFFGLRMISRWRLRRRRREFVSTLIFFLFVTLASVAFIATEINSLALVKLDSHLEKLHENRKLFEDDDDDDIEIGYEIDEHGKFCFFLVLLPMNVWAVLWGGRRDRLSVLTACVFDRNTHASGNTN